MLDHEILQIGDVAVLDISATTIDQDKSNVQRIPSAESKGLPNLFMEICERST